MNKICKELFESADLVVVDSEFEMNAIHERNPEIEVAVIPPSIDAATVTSSGMMPKTPNKIFGVACVAQDIPAIDIPSLMKAWSIVAKETNRIAFGLFSSPLQLMQWNIQDLVEIYGLQNKITIQANPENYFDFLSMGDLYSSIDLLIFPHQEEVVNIPALEGTQCGRKMIIPRGGPTAEFIDHPTLFLENTDVLIGPPMNFRYTVFDAKEMADGILSIANDKNAKVKRMNLEKCKTNTVMQKWVDVVHES